MLLINYAKRIARNWAAHDNSRAAAAISFFAIFTFAPMLVFATAALGMFISQQEAQSLTEERLAETVGPTAARVAKEVLQNVDFSHNGFTTSAVSALVLLYGASSVFFQLRKTLDYIFGSRSPTKHGAMMIYLFDRLIAALCVIVATVALVATLIGHLALNRLSEDMLLQTSIPKMIWQLFSTSASALVVAIVVVALLKFLPSRPPKWRHVLPGAIVCVLLFELGKWLFGIYVSNSLIASAYGPSSAIVAFVLWVFYSTQIFILGAEVSSVAGGGRQAE